MTHKLVNYEEAKAASKRGEKVEYRSKFSLKWKPYSHGLSEEWQFRIPDPYADLKAAQAAGKVIQGWNIATKEWQDLNSPAWMADCKYRVKPDPKPDELVIEPGKEYRTRTGIKARVYAIDGRFNQVIHGATLNYEGEWIVITWLSSGRRFQSENSGLDLIAPWTDEPEPYDNWRHVPAWARWQALQPDGIWTLFDMKPNQGSHGWFSQGWETNIPSSYIPTNYTGTWEQSLQERPE